MLPRGGPARLAPALAAAGLLARPWTQPWAFALALRASGTHPRAGEFAFPAHASLAEVLAILRDARPVQHRLTIPEGLTAAQIALLLDRAEALAGADVLPPEGGVLPQTYDYERGTTRAALLTRAEAAMRRALADAWAVRAPGLPLASPAQALTLASIVERETARPEERAHVAAVFANRLRLGMKLQSDATVAYAASGGLGRLDRPLSRADLASATPYNTYRLAGLPPAPIASPGLDSLRAATQPAASDDLYFVADGSGGHVFAHDLDSHNRNVAHWRALTPTAR
jgi:UPF0755 protein